MAVESLALPVVRHIIMFNQFQSWRREKIMPVALPVQATRRSVQPETVREDDDELERELQVGNTTELQVELEGLQLESAGSYFNLKFLIAQVATVMTR